MHARRTQGSRWLWLLLAAMGSATGTAQAQAPADPYNHSRTSSYTYYQPADGAKAGLLKSETIEPGNAPACVVTAQDYDAYGNKKLTTVANCPGAAGRALFDSRSSTITYAGVASQREADRSLRLPGSNCREWFSSARPSSSTELAEV